MMLHRVRVAACQINTVVGDLYGNAERILAALAEAETGGADLAVFPELTVTGYPPEDLLSRPAFVAENLAVFDRIAAASGPCAAVVGYVDTDGAGRLVNAAALCARGQVLGRYFKRLLPNYGVFDEQRWFVPGQDPAGRFVVAGVPVGLSICEDMWFAGGPMAEEAEAGAALLVNLNASPYSRGRRQERLAVLEQRVAETGCAIVYVNQVGGQDELVFDGASVVLGSDGDIVASASQFAEEVLLVDLGVETDGADPGTGVTMVSAEPRSSDGDGGVGRMAPLLDPEAEVYEALVLGTRDYVAKNGFTDAVIGLSGGIDSSLVAVVAVDALGPEHVHGVTMPSRYSSEGSVTDAVTLADNLGVDIATVAIEPAHRALAASLSPLLGGDPVGLTDENLQSRIRGVVLMALSNANGWIVLTTGNKSEMATGYSTLYGDSAGGFAVIKDVPKLLVYALCRYRNGRAGHALIPEPVLTKAPSAELRPDQRDDESLPPYEVLDPVVAGYVEGDRSADDLIASGFDPAAVERVVGLVDRAEYKRRQMPPGVRISGKAFGKDRRMPITNHYRSRVGPGAAPVDPVPGDAAAPATVSDGSIGEATTIV
jgi:NAD+ synthase (glutamine-hydrolysing)